MSKNAFLDKFRGNKASTEAVPETPESIPSDMEIDGGVDHLWMKEDLDAQKPTLEKDPRIETGILRNRIAEKLTKLNNH
jgi:hypothetical protein